MTPHGNHFILPHFTKFWTWLGQEATALHNPEILVSETGTPTNIYS